MKLKDCLLDREDINLAERKATKKRNFSFMDISLEVCKAQLDSPKLKAYIEEQADAAVRTFQETYTDIVLAKISD